MSKIKLLKIVLLFFISLKSTFVLAQSQNQMNQDQSLEYKKVDAKLGVLYQKIIKEYNGNAEFITALRNSERAWIVFRDAEVKLHYPASNTRLEYGSVYPLCVYSLLIDITKKRIDELNIWLTGMPEGDACNGSIKMKN